MNLAVVHIIYFSDESYEVEARLTNERFILANEILKDISESRYDIDLLVFPAGYLASPSHDECFPLAKRFVENLALRNYVVMFGVNHAVHYDKASQAPYDYSHGFVVGPNGEQLVWGVNQQGIGRADRIQSHGIKEQRLFNVAGFKAGLLLCGEMNAIMDDVEGNPRMSEYLARESDILIDLTHADRQITPPSMSWFPAMVDARCPSVVAEHIWNDYLGDRLYSHSAETGIDYSCMLEVVESKLTSKYNLVIYSTH